MWHSLQTRFLIDLMCISNIDDQGKSEHELYYIIHYIIGMIIMLYYITSMYYYKTRNINFLNHIFTSKTKSCLKH